MCQKTAQDSGPFLGHLRGLSDDRIVRLEPQMCQKQHRALANFGFGFFAVPATTALRIRAQNYAKNDTGLWTNLGGGRFRGSANDLIAHSSPELC